MTDKDKDAGRYSFLRELHDAGDEQWFVYGAPDGKLDEAIDAELARRCRAQGGSTNDYVSPVAAPTIPAQVPAAEVRAQAFEEAAKACDEIESDRFDAYKGRGKHAPNNPDRADPYVNGKSDGAGECAAAIRSLAQSSTADKASEVRAVEWISVEDARKPEERKPVLLFVRTLTRGEDDDGRPYETEGEQIEMGEYRFNNGSPYFSCFVSPMSDNDWVTHWMNLPAAPSTADSGNTGALGEGAEA